MARHLMEHAKNYTATCFHCLVCSDVYETTSELAEHLSSGKFGIAIMYSRERVSRPRAVLYTYHVHKNNIFKFIIFIISISRP